MENDNIFRPQENIDEALQREIDDALGEMNLEDIADSETSAPTGEKAAAQGVRRGRVIAIERDDIFVDMGGRSEGLLPADQFADEPLPEVGSVVEVTIEGYDGGNGLLLLSREGAVQAATWETLDEGQIVEGLVTGHNKGGLELTINGIRAFMPISQIEMFRVEEISDYDNRKMSCQVVEVDRADQNVIVSRRAVLELEAQEKAEELWQTLEEGVKVPGTVRTIMPYGAFVDIGGVDGLLHVSDMSHGRVEDPKELLSEGQQLEVLVLKVDRQERKISLGLKQILADPWEGVESKYQSDTIVTAKVTRLAEFGAFAQLEEGVEGLIPISELTFERRVNHPREIVVEGDMVKVRVLNVDPDRRRIGLSLKRVGDDPWTGASARWKVGGVVDGRITRITDFGAFVELAGGVEGLVHISELSFSHVKSVADAVKEGDRIAVKILDVDEERRRISLSIKQAGAETSAGDYSTGTVPPVETKKSERPLKGGLD